LEKLVTLVDMHHSYPLVVRRDKNKSDGIYRVMKGENMSKTMRPRDKEAEHLQLQIEGLWAKIEEKYSTLAQAFRFFDQQCVSKYR